MRYHSTVDVTPLVYKTMKLMLLKHEDNKMISKDPKDDLFEMINASRLNDYFKTFMSDLSAKVFRTYNASITLQN